MRDDDDGVVGGEWTFEGPRCGFRVGRNGLKVVGANRGMKISKGECSTRAGAIGRGKEWTSVCSMGVGRGTCCPGFDEG